MEAEARMKPIAPLPGVNHRASTEAKEDAIQALEPTRDRVKADLSLAGLRTRGIVPVILSLSAPQWTPLNAEQLRDYKQRMADADALRDKRKQQAEAPKMREEA